MYMYSHDRCPHMYVHFYLEESCYMYNFMCVVTILGLTRGLTRSQGWEKKCVSKMLACLRTACL